MITIEKFAGHIAQAMSEVLGGAFRPDEVMEIAKKVVAQSNTLKAVIVE